MIMRKYIFMFLAFFFLFIGSKIYKNKVVHRVESIPVPSEFSLRKMKKKDLKKHRKEYIRKMHKSHPDTDWEEMDRVSRMERINSIQESIKDRLQNTKFSRDNRVTISSRDIEGEWFEKGSNNLSGRIRTADIDFENNMVYCVSSGGNIWRGSLNGNQFQDENWESLNDHYQIKSTTMIRVIDYNNSMRIIVVANHGVFITDNNGLLIEESNGLEFLDDWGYIKRSIMSNSGDKILLLVNEWDNEDWRAEAAIYESIDYGDSFTKLLSLDESQGFSQIEQADHFDIWMSRYFGSEVFLINDTDLYILDGPNLEFTSSMPGSQNGDVALTGGMGLNSEFLYSYIGGRIFHSQNAGSSWSDKGDSPSDWWWINGFNSSNINRDLIYIGGMELFKSSNYGDNWSLVNNWWDYYNDPQNKLHADIPEVRFFLDLEFNEVALISTDGGIYFSDDYLNSVNNISMSGLGVSQYYSTFTQPISPYNIYAGSQDQGFQRSTSDNGGIREFDQIISGDYGHLGSGDQGESVWANYPGFTILFPNAANSNQSRMLDFPCSGQLWLAPLLADPMDANLAYLGGGGVSGGNHIIKIINQGSSLTYEELPPTFNGTISAMAISPINNNNWYILTENGKFYRSIDSGISWNQSMGFTGPGAHYFYGSTIVPSYIDDNIIYIGGSGYSNAPVYVSYNNGSTFTSMNSGLPNTLVYKLASTDDGSILFAATEIGPYAYDIYDEVWYDIGGMGAPDQTYWSVEYIPELLTARFGTYGRGIWDFKMDENYNFIIGDINNDTVINIQDIIFMINFILSYWEPNDYQILAGDFNSDGALDIIDIVNIVNIILGR